MDVSSRNFSAHNLAVSLENLKSLDIRASVLGECLRNIAEAEAEDNTEKPAGIITSDPALCLTVLRLCAEQRISPAQSDYSIADMIKRLGLTRLGQLLLNADMAEDLTVRTAEFLRFNYARAVAAELISELSGKANPNCCRLAGLLCGAGRVALARLYPKSLEMITTQAQKTNRSVICVQREKLGTDENLISKRLAEKWQLPPEITEAIWLCEAREDTILAAAENPDTALIVRLATIITDSAQRQPDIGYETMPARTVGLLTNRQSGQVIERVKQILAQQTDSAGMNPQSSTQMYYQAVRDFAVKSIKNTAGYNNIYRRFVDKLAGAITSYSSLTGAQKAFAQIFCEVFSIEKICVFLKTATGSALQAVTFDGRASQSSVLARPEGFNIEKTNLTELTPWLFEQIETDFNLSRTNSVQLRNREKTIGGFIYETAVQQTDVCDIYRRAADFGAEILSVIASVEKFKSIAERLVNLEAASVPEPPQKPQKPITRNEDEKPDDKNIFASVAELAAGAAHELNNPLTVISGRVQMLSERETDRDKQTAFRQIITKIKDVEEIVGELMEFARPAEPQVRNVSPFILTNRCLEKVASRYGDELLDITTENIETLSDVRIDTEQTATAFAEIIFNSLESYENGNGPVKIIGSEHPQSGEVEISISDSGCGMSENTLVRAIEPFYSDKPAGRQRGMGLTIAKRLLENNNCRLEIRSHSEHGTIVTISLPK